MISVSSARYRNLDHTAENHRRVFRTKPNTVRQSVTDHRLARLGWDIIEIALRISKVEIQSRRNEILLQCEHDGADSGRAACALRMANHRLRRAHWNPIRTV